MSKTDTSWQKVGKWYSGLVDQKGHYYHEHVVIPGTLELLNVTASSTVLDLACGQGILGRSLPDDVGYTGVDAAPGLITEARRLDHNPKHNYITADVTQPLSLGQSFSHAAIILALQNIGQPEKTLENAASHLNPGGTLVIVINHPCFRIPRQSSWETDINNKIEYRRINRYLSPLKIPITIHPGKNSSPVVWSFHQPLRTYTWMLHDAGFIIEVIDEWNSDKVSQGKAAKMENRARSEFPLFLAIQAIKIH